MEEPIIIAPTYSIAEYFCRQILELSPRKHAMSARTAYTTGLLGRNEPLVILYLYNDPISWKGDDYSKVIRLLQVCRAKVIQMPEVQRISR